MCFFTVMTEVSIANSSTLHFSSNQNRVVNTWRFVFFQEGTVTNPTIWLVLSAVRIFISLTTVTITLAWVFFVWEKEVIYQLRVGPYSEKQRPWKCCRSQFFIIRTSQPANNIYLPCCILQATFTSEFSNCYELVPWRATLFSNVSNTIKCFMYREAKRVENTFITCREKC